MGNKFNSTGNNTRRNAKILFAICTLFLVLAITAISAIGFKYKEILSKANLTPEQLRTINYEELIDEKVADCENVNFGVFFTEDRNGNGEAEKILGACSEIDKTKTMYIEVGVNQGGTLKNAVISINGSNFNYRMQMLQSSVLKNNYISNNVKTIELNNMSSGNVGLLMGDVYARISSKDDYSRVNTVTLTGTWESDEINPETGVKDTVKINQTREITIDWYGTAGADITAYNEWIDLNKLMDSEDKTITFDFAVNETKRQLLTKQNFVTVTMPELFGEYPTSVECINQGIESQYDETTHTLTISKETSSYTNTYTIKAQYPDEAYEQIYNGYTLSADITGYYKCYNNTNEEFDSINDPAEKLFITNTASAKKAVVFDKGEDGSHAHFVFSAQVSSKSYVTAPTKGYAISKQNIIDAFYAKNNNQYIDPENVEYVVKWCATRTTKPLTDKLGIILNEPDVASGYGDTWDGYQMSEYTNNTGLYFANIGFIPQDGYVRVYNNEDNTLIKEFTYDELSNYNSINNAYKFEDEGIKHIRVETTQVDPAADSKLEIYSVKEVNTEKVLANFTQQQIENARILKTNVNGKLTNGVSVNGSEQCKLSMEKSYAQLAVSQDIMSITETTPIEQKITIEVPRKDDISYPDWKNGEFIVEIPSQINYMKIDEVTSSNQDVEIAAYDITKENGKYFIKIITENDTPTSGFNIVISSKMVIVPTQAASSAKLNLYSYNPNRNIYHFETSDKYDVNGNEDYNEKVGISSAEIRIQSANSFLTTETVSNYDDTEEVTIAPNIAEILKGKDSAQINVSFVDNQDARVQNIAILGKIPFEGNTYINGNSLGSEYTTEMSTGITIPSELENNATVYYSTSEKPETAIETEDGKITSSKLIESIEAENSTWIPAENVTDLSSVRAYLIVIDGTVTKGKTYTFSYKIAIPNDTPINEKTYSCHLASYEYDTGNGYLAITVTPNKVGMRVTKYYDMELTKYKEGTSLAVPGARYELTAVEENESATENEETSKESHIITSTSEGKIAAKSLRVNQIYTLKEVQAPSAYELKDETITFKVTETVAGAYEFNQISEEGFSSAATIVEKNGSKVLTANIEDAPRFALNLTKKAEGKALSNVRFEINGASYMTDANGKVKLENLSVNKEYTLKETYAQGYYLLDEIKFTVKQTENNGYIVESNNPVFANKVVENTEQEDLLQLNVELINEKIPTYTLNIVKVDEATPTNKLQGAKFLLNKIDTNNAAYVTTNEEGEATISDLYAYVSGKNSTGRYTLKETKAPDGYVKNSEEISFVVEKNGNDELQVVLGTIEEPKAQSDYSTIKEISVEGDVVTFTLQDKPIFKIKKVDSEEVDGNNNKAPIQGAEFSIYKLNTEGKLDGFATDTAGNTVGRLNEDGLYTLSSDEKGEITASLPAGNYKAIEVGTPEGYEEEAKVEVFTVTGEDEADESTVSAEQIEEWKNITIDEPTYTDEEEADLEITKIEQLLDFATAVNNGTFTGKKVVLKNDLDFTNANDYEDATDTERYGDFNGDEVTEDIKTELTKAEGAGFIPIGLYDSSNESHPFTGIFDGNGYTIRNLHVKSTKGYSGLFGYADNAVIKNLTVTGDVGESSFTAGICGYATNQIYIENCKNECTLNKDNKDASIISGILGKFAHTDTSQPMVVSIISCENSGNIKGGINTAGIVGRIEGSGINNGGRVVIKNCKNTGDILGSNYSGGICGYVDNTTMVKIQDVTNSGKINSQYSASQIGGVLGYIANVSLAHITRAENTAEGIITGGGTNTDVGGLIGRVNAVNYIYLIQSKNKANIQNCGQVGGLVGEFNTKSNAYIEECYNEGNIISVYDGSDGVGGLIGLFAGDSYGGTNTANLYIEHSYNKGNVISNCSQNATGGIVGETCYVGGKVVIEHCYNEGRIECSSGYRAAGIFARSIGTIGQTIVYDCYNSGMIVAGSAGGILGEVKCSSGSEIKDCYNYGTISSPDSYSSSAYLGGIFAYALNDAQISGCSNAGNIIAIGSNTQFVGGVAGYVSNTLNISNCSNTGNVTINNHSGTSMIGGVVGSSYSSASTVDYCCNTGDVEIKDGRSDIWIGGIAGQFNGTVNHTYNTGEISYTGTGYPSMGGIIGNGYSNTVVTYSYNSGKIQNNISSTSSSYNYIGGIAGRNVSKIKYCYNTGEVNSSIGQCTGEVRVGGIAGQINNECTCSYNVGNVYNNVTSYSNAGNIYTGKIVGQMSNSAPSAYYVNTMDLGTPANETIKGTALTEDEMKSQNFITTLGGTANEWLYIPNEYPILDFSVINKANKAVELTVENTKKSYNITVEIENKQTEENSSYVALGIGGNKLYGSEGKQTVETVKYGNTNESSLRVVSGPNVIESITINGNAIEMTEEQQSGTYSIPAGYFSDINEEKDIKVVFANQTKYLSIVKKDADSGERLSGAKFKIESDAAIGNNLLGELTANGTYSFIPGTFPGQSWQTNYCSGDSFITPTNNGVPGTYAYSYYKLDLTSETEEVYVSAKAYEGQGGVLFGYISEDTAIRPGVITDGFLFANRTGNEMSYLSDALAPGKVYYVHLGYLATTSSVGEGIYMNISDLKAVHASDLEFEMKNYGENILEQTENGYEMTSFTTNDQSHSYIPVNLEGKTGKYRVSFNLKFANCGATIMLTEDESIPEYDSNKVIYSNGGTKSLTLATKELEGGNKYYIHIGFTPFANSSGQRFIISDVKLVQDINRLVAETDINGQAMLEVPAGNYTITETTAPEGYELNRNPVTYTVVLDQENKVEIPNAKKKSVIVHYYEKGTGEEYQSEPIRAKEDEYLYGSQGENYDTNKIIQLQIGDYSLAVDEDNNYIIPDNSSGTYASEPINVYYYYEKKNDDLINLLIKKAWETLDDVNDYRATMKVTKIVNGREMPVVDNVGNDLTVTIQGNGMEYIANLPKYENGELIEYKVEEIKIEKKMGINYETQEDVWEEIPLEKFGSI